MPREEQAAAQTQGHILYVHLAVQKEKPTTPYSHFTATIGKDSGQAKHLPLMEVSKALPQQPEGNKKPAPPLPRMAQEELMVSQTVNEMAKTGEACQAVVKIKSGFQIMCVYRAAQTQSWHPLIFYHTHNKH